ncbi:DNA-binding response OmpR family regulator [Catenulispora sp. GAS73]|uniref:response regulator transcription factor n=1 Tax=Catenulispora sp. GAS73 TaxID=3156269 RepID=UPI003513E21A
MDVLVVEDDPDVATAVRRGLESEGWTVDVAGDGATGLRLARRHDYQAIILDIMLPALNGYRVCAELRQAGVRTPILMLTAKDGEWDEAEALDTGADDYLRKPFAYVVLLARLRALIRRGGGAEGGLLRVGDLWIDPAARRAGRGEQPVELTAREFDVLLCLARYAGQALTRRAVVEEVWDLAYTGEPTIVEVYISALRRKIDAPFGRHSLQTVRGIGYRLTDDADA